ncbi:ATR-interacting protein, partial [Clarias magur]
MDYPPSKRHRGSHNENLAGTDTFGDDEDFTQDDLEEIDIIASQAITKDVQATTSKRSFASFTVYPEETRVPVREVRKTFAIGNSHLKEVEEQILMKNGEIRVLRDSLRLANQEKEQQRQTHLELERDRAHVQSEKEKELSKKVESLKSELHFKEAEMNEMRNKFQSSERGAKVVGTPIRNSASSPGNRAFVTKESFSAELPGKPAAAEGRRTDGGKQSQEKGFKGHMSSATANGLHHKGPALLNLLLQHPLEPSSLGFCHLLCISPDALPAILTQSDYPSPTSSSGSSSSSTDIRLLHQPCIHFYQHQRLAMSGLAMLTHGASTQLLRRSCPPAVHFLPLLHYHISLYCQTLETSDKSGKSPLRPSALSGTSDSSSAFTVEESIGVQEEFAIAAMKALYHIVCESSEAVISVLGGKEIKDSEKPDENRTCQHQSTGHCSTSENHSDDLQSHSALLKMLFQLVDVKFVSSAGQREVVVNCSLRTLCALAERAEEDSQLLRFQVVLGSQTVTQNLSLDSPYSTVWLFVRLLALLADCDKIANKLCSHKYICPFARLFQYVTSRSNKGITEDMWSRLEVEVVRLLAKLFTQKMLTWAAFNTESSCLCSSEVVRTVVLVLHRQWLSIKALEKQVGGIQTWTSPGVHSLRETLMLLHWLLLNDSSFSMHCLDVLHMYHQIIPGIRDTLRRIPDLTECE